MQKLHLICGDKDEFQYILVTKEKTIATDLYCVLIFETGSLFGEDFYESLNNDDRFLIHKNEWMKLTKPYISFSINEDKIKIIRKNNITDYIELKKEGDEIKYNDKKIFDIISSRFIYEGESIKHLAINPILYKNMQEAIYPEVSSRGSYPLFLDFPNNYNSYSNAIKITTNVDDLYKYEAYIMPMKPKK